MKTYEHQMFYNDMRIFLLAVYIRDMHSQSKWLKSFASRVMFLTMRVYRRRFTINILKRV